MTTQELLVKLDEVLNKAKAGVLGTVGSNGQPHLRWMTPALLRGRPGYIYAVTSPAFAKLVDVQANPRVQWLIQTPSLREICALEGMLRVIDNPALKNEIVETIGKILFVFWKVNPSSDFVVLETRITQATYFCPMKGVKETVTF
ncbi:MAG: pyridoxamine 5'-phosphate oxidase family protein [bacterium]|nr:pyridoxamine 5'-phosphate oxidase family protein [bacterium]